MKNYLIGFAICFVLVGIISAFTFRNRIYAWTLGDVQALYTEATTLYKARQYEEAVPLFEQLAGIDTAAYCKFVLGDMHYRGLTGEVDYQKAITLFKEAAELNNTDAHNNLAVMYLSGHGVQADYSKAFRHFQYGAANGNQQRDAHTLARALGLPATQILPYECGRRQGDRLHRQEEQLIDLSVRRPAGHAVRPEEIDIRLDENV